MNEEQNRIRIRPEEREVGEEEEKEEDIVH